MVTFDDRLWPVNVAIAILASFAAAPLVATGRFDDPRPLANGWTHLGLLAVGALFLMWCASLIGRRRVRRRLELATLVSLIFHLSCIAALYSQRFDRFAERPPRTPPEDVPPEVFVAPDYAFRTPGTAALERVEPDLTIVPDPKSSTLARLQPQPLEALPLDSPPTPVASAAPEVPPSVVELNDQREAAPQLADHGPLLNKQAAREIQIGEPVAGPLAGDDQTQEELPLQPQSVPLAHRLESPEVVPLAILPAAPSKIRAGDSPRFGARALEPRLAERLDAPETRLPQHGAAMPRVAARINVSPELTGPVSTADTERPAVETKVEASSVPLSPDAALGRSPIAERLAELQPAPAGIGGPDATRIPEVGLPSRRAPEDSDLAHTGAERPLGRKRTGPPAVDGRLREPAAPFARRGSQRPNKGSDDEFSQASEAAIELGLDFLARHQAADGSWKLNFAGPGQPGSEERASFRSDSAATGLALLSFLGAGHDHYGGSYQGVVQRALDYLLKSQKQDGDLYRPLDAASNKSAWLYSHGIASIALCEAYGMTGDPALAGAAQRAVNFIVAAQDPKQGAWRYTPGSGSDTSVSGWQLMALKSAELAGLNVRADAYQKVSFWLDHAQVAGSQFVYNPTAPNTPEQRHGRRATPAMTAVGLLMRLYTGWNRNDPRMIEGAEYLLGRLPQRGSAAQPARDTYYWYYATQVMFHMRGKYWRAWNDRLQRLLIGEQVVSGPLAGSWDPLKPVPDRWGPQGGRIYVTTLNLLSLEVYYRHLPIYESTAK
ncbi:MAG TPA: hypothetical protein VGZ26_02900 [Pirellulales bacterium]|nr:hypothetical protein [Pirellulales bacterium]